MKSERLYYIDAYSTHFEAKIRHRLTVDTRPAVILDHTFFYPDSGGQPNDTGKINEVPVIDVFVHDGDSSIVHVLTDSIDMDEVTAEIDWSRRFDHMQQHTGQHILSRVFLENANANTISFHLGNRHSTIDLERPDISWEHLKSVEDLANQIVWSNRPISVQFADKSELDELDLRSRPLFENDQVRLINIDGFDLTPCGGTHVASTGELGLIKVIRQEKFKGGTRITFVCGRRALEDYQTKNHLLKQLSDQFTTSAEKIIDSVVKLQSEAKDDQRQVKKLLNRLADFEAQRYRDQGTKIGIVNVVADLVSDRSPGEVRSIANKLIQGPDTIVLFAIEGPGLQFIFCRSEGTSVDMGQLLKLVIDEFDSLKGGGSSSFAQASGPAAHPSRVNRALMEARQYLVEMLR